MQRRDLRSREVETRMGQPGKVRLLRDCQAAVLRTPGAPERLAQGAGLRVRHPEIGHAFRPGQTCQRRVRQKEVAGSALRNAQVEAPERIIGDLAGDAETQARLAVVRRRTQRQFDGHHTGSLYRELGLRPRG